MVNFLRKLLGVQTLKLVLVDPVDETLSSQNIASAFKNLPVLIFFVESMAGKGIRVIDTGIPIPVRSKINGLGESMQLKFDKEGRLITHNE